MIFSIKCETLANMGLNSEKSDASAELKMPRLISSSAAADITSAVVLQLLSGLLR